MDKLINMEDAKKKMSENENKLFASLDANDDDVIKYNSEDEGTDLKKRFNTGVDEAYNEDDEDYMTLNREHRDTIANLLMDDSAIETIETDYYLDGDDMIMSKKNHRNLKDKTPKEILDGIKKRVIINEIRSNIKNKYDDLYDPLHIENMNERTHFIEPISNIKHNHYSNMKFSTFFQNAHLKSYEYNKLLECLSKIIIN